LPEILPRRDIDERDRTGPGPQHAHTEPSQVSRAQPLRGGKSSRIRLKQGCDARHRQPDQHLIAGDDSDRGGQTARDAAFAGRRDDGQITRSGNQQKCNHGHHIGAVVGDAKHACRALQGRE